MQRAKYRRQTRLIQPESCHNSEPFHHYHYHHIQAEKSPLPSFASFQQQRHLATTTTKNKMILSTLLLLISLILDIAPVTIQAQNNQPHQNVAMQNNIANNSIIESVRNNDGQHNDPHHTSSFHQQSPLASARGKYVKLGDSTSLNVKYLNNNQYITHHVGSSRLNQSNNLTVNKSGDNQGSQRKSSFEKMCIGTSNRMSAQHNKTDHYQNLAERYKNCTIVIGNLEITWLEKTATDLTFLESIREITGHLLIAYVEVEKIKMPNLQIIRGRDLFKLNNNKDEFAIFLLDNEIKSLELPNLREILAGSVGSYNNRNLCYMRKINWDEILNVPFRSVFSYNGSPPECSCDASCQMDNCWGDGPDMCQKFSKTNCSPQCSQGRCFGSLPRECCHLFCAGGCTGPKQTDCIACKNFDDDGECIQECPSMERYNPSKFLWEPNPNGKYAFGATCVKECPDHLLRDNGACVRTCPPNKRSANGECVPCGGPCPKNCQGVEVVHSGNIDQLINCTVIEGSITILDTSFQGYAEYHPNNSMAVRHKPMHPSRLEVFRTLREITGYLNIQASHMDFKNLSYFRNLKTIGGRQTTDMFYALSIIKTSLVSLNLRSLGKVRSGRITIEENKDLCFADTIDWNQINITRKDEITIRNNADNSRCRHLGLQCHEQCAKDGCWGPGPDECLSCNNHKLDNICVDNCTSTQSVGFLSFDAGNRICKKCHSECRGGCTGTEARHCWQCKNVKDGPYCVAECPSHKYNNNGYCLDCDKNCIDGCTGPTNRMGEGGCNSCGKAVINSTSPALVAHCIKTDDPCPDGYYQEYVGPHAEGPLRSLSGKPICRKCHHRCKTCTGMGTHVSVCECAKYVAGEQCEDFCSRDYYADAQLRQCVRCSPECNGCFGPTEADCVTCRVYRIYTDSYSPIASARVTTGKIVPDGTRQQVRFNCTAQCPIEKPYRISDSNMLDPYCSENLGNDDEVFMSSIGRVLTGSTLLIFIFFIPVAITSCILIRRCQMEKDKTVKLTMQLSGFDDVEPLNQSNMKPNLASLTSIKESELRKGSIIGSGFGGTVYQGLWYPEGQEHKDPKPVAIKVLHNNGQSKNKEFLDEAYIMASVQHPNLVRLLAVCMTPNQLMLVTPLMPLGCLLEYVKNPKNDIGSKNLLEWCKQIAKGMAYLEEQRMVHRDLALRNVLLQKTGKAMISDFGLAKFLEVDQSEYHSGGGKLPIKWLAPECISEQKFTHKSDVWAFGVTIWELMTFGAKPFENYETSEVPQAIMKGARLEQPPHMTAEVYKVMYACWFYNPDDRPNFRSLAENFINFARDPERYLSIGRFKGVKYSNRQELGLNMDGDENGFYGYSNGFADEDSQPRSALPDLVSGALGAGRPNEMQGFDAKHHLESDSVHGQQLSTPPFNKMFQNNGQHLLDEGLFQAMGNQVSAKISPTPVTDLNNNLNSVTDNGNMLNMNTETFWPGCMRPTVSNNSLGQKSEQPTDKDDYLLPSPCSNDAKFTKFLASHERPKLPPAPNFSRDPPHSAGLIENFEYFLTRMDYMSSNGPTNASSGHIPSSLV